MVPLSNPRSRQAGEFELIVSSDHRKREFLQKIQSSVFAEFAKRVNFPGYESLVKQYEIDLLRSNQVFLL